MRLDQKIEYAAEASDVLDAGKGDFVEIAVHVVGVGIGDDEFVTDVKLREQVRIVGVVRLDVHFQIREGNSIVVGQNGKSSFVG